MKIALMNMWQNATHYIDRYVCAEGDSVDGNATWVRLNTLLPGKVFKRVHGGQIYGPVDVTQRWLQIAFVMDGCLERVQPYYDAAIWVESDLMWEPATMLKLLEYIERPGVDAAVPMIWMNGGFYDTWAYRKDNVRFTVNPPYHNILTRPPVNGLYQLDSGGGCVAMRGQVARECRCRPPALAAVGFYQDMKSHGWNVWLDRNLSVVHPPVR